MVPAALADGPAWKPCSPCSPVLRHRQALNQLGRHWAAELSWLDPLHAGFSLSVAPSDLPAQLLMELHGNDQLVVRGPTSVKA